MAAKRYAWPENVSPISETFPISEYVAEFAAQTVISHISTNLSIYGISSKS